MRFRAEPSRHQDCRTVFASFARLNHSGPITFYAEMGMFAEPSRRVLQEQSSTPKSTQVRAVPERGNQGQTQHKGTAAGTAHAALVARRRSRRGLTLLKRPRHPSRFSFFLLLLKIDGKPCFTFFFSPFSPKLGFQNLTEARIARTLTATLLSHSLWA
jgi:hypothetical protein